MSAPDDLTPKEVAQRWLDKRAVELSEDTQSTYWYRIKKVVDFCETEDIDRMTDLTPWKLDEFDTQFRSRAPQKVTISKEYRTIINWLEWAESLGIVEDGLADVLDPPETTKDEEVNTERLTPDVAAANLQAYRSQPLCGDRANVHHTLLELMWWSGARVSAICGLDKQDINLDAGTIEFVHRPESDTPIKPGYNQERIIGMPDDVVAVLADYQRDCRHAETFDEFGREPFLTTTHGRVSRTTARRYSKFATLPCHGGPCPHEKEPATCEWVSLRNARGCPSSRSPHAVRTGAITNLLNAGWSLDQVAERVNTSPQRIKQHYDFPDKGEEYRERRAELVDRLGLNSEDGDTHV